MIFKKYLLFGIICLAVSLKAQGKSLNAEVSNTSGELNSKHGDIESSDSKFNDGVSNQATVIQANAGKLRRTYEKQDNQNETEINNDGSKATPHVINVMQMVLNDEDKVMLQNLNRIIEKVPKIKDAATISRVGKAFKDEHFKRAAEALTDDEITEIIKSISFPNTDDITEDSEALKPTSAMEVEPRMGKSLSRKHGYYVIAFTPIAEEANNNHHDTVPYSRLQILPAERSLNDYAGDNPRVIGKKTWNKYIRRIMREIRKGTRRIQRKGTLKGLHEESTWADFLKRMYIIGEEQRLKQQQTKKKSSWFTWR